MYTYRITKYNPVNRDNFGKYMKDEWTSISDIGKIYEASEFTIKEYYSTESKYIDAILNFTKYLNLDKLEVTSLEKNFSYKDDVSCYEEKYKEYYTDEMEQIFDNVCNGVYLNVHEVEVLCRLILREHIWCKLEIENVMFVHFGYDYYMYVGVYSECIGAIEEIRDSGLFVENYESPYLVLDNSEDD